MALCAVWNVRLRRCRRPPQGRGYNICDMALGLTDEMQLRFDFLDKLLRRRSQFDC
jgi:hypothetical protein